MKIILTDIEREQIKKKLINKVKEVFDESADKTDIWDNERYDKFRKIFRKEIDKLVSAEIGTREKRI